MCAEKEQSQLWQESIFSSIDPLNNFKWLHKQNYGCLISKWEKVLPHHEGACRTSHAYKVEEEKRGAPKEEGWGLDSLRGAFFWSPLIRSCPAAQGMEDSQKYFWAREQLAVSDSQPVVAEFEIPSCIKGDHTLLLGGSSSRDKCCVNPTGRLCNVLLRSWQHMEIHTILQLAFGAPHSVLRWS